MKALAIAIIVAAVLISGSIVYYAREHKTTTKPHKHCFVLREPNFGGVGGYHDELRCVTTR